MDQLTQWLCASTGCTEATAARLVYSVATVVLLWALRFLTLRIAWRRTEDVRTRYTWRKVSGYVSNSPQYYQEIVVDPNDPDRVYSLDTWFHVTEDGGKTWEKTLGDEQWTGVTDIVMHPENPDVLYAAAYQRRRHVWTLVNGGPESAIYKSTDAGANWRKLTEGLPTVDMGKIGMDISPVTPDVVYAVIEAQRDKGGFFRSTDRGESWEKMSDYMSVSAQYYNELVADPVQAMGAVPPLTSMFRDVGAGGPTSNFTDAIEIAFQ